MFSNFVFEFIINIYLIVARCFVVEANSSIILLRLKIYCYLLLFIEHEHLQFKTYIIIKLQQKPFCNLL